MYSPQQKRQWLSSSLLAAAFGLGVPVGCRGGVSVSISYPVNETWVPGWEPVDVAYSLLGGRDDFEAATAANTVVCFRLVENGSGGCGPLQEGLPVSLDELHKGQWYTLESTIEAVGSVTDEAHLLHTSNTVGERGWKSDGESTAVMSRDVSVFFTAVSPKDPWGHVLPNLAAATGATGVAGSCTPEMDNCVGDKATRTWFFDAVYEHGVWAKNSPGHVSSGSGSTMENTEGIRMALEEFISTARIRRLLDVPCGDMTWMGSVNLDGVEYIGADVSQVVLRRNRAHVTDAKHGATREFIHLDLVEEGIPSHLGQFDLILVRDLMYHQTQEDNLVVIEHLENSGAKYVMLSTYLEADDNNRGDGFLLVNGH
ncbi:unnamed protein product, partial [Discosporangium mesarthrocarpum]